MPNTDAPNENLDSILSATSIAESLPSETESVTFSEFDFEFNIGLTLSSTPSDDILLETDSVDLEIDPSILSSRPSSPASCESNPDFDLLKWTLPIEYNLRQMLIKVTDTEDLDSVTSIKLRVIASEVSIQRIPYYLPRLTELNLNGSCLMTLRDLGCGLQNLTILHVCNTGIKSLDGLFAFTDLKEFYASGNLIKDLSPCSAFQNIDIIDLGNNKITELQKVGFLALCTTLTQLTLEGNPSTGTDDYQEVVQGLLPNLKYLDGVPLTRDL